MSDLPRLKQEIIERLDLRGLYESQLVKSLSYIPTYTTGTDGWSTRVLCPFHNDNATPNFSFNVVNGSFRCFACNASGSVFDFWCLSHGLDKQQNFMKAVQHLADEANIDVKDWAAVTPTSVAPIDATRTPPAIRGFKPVNKAEQADKSKSPIPRKTADDFHAALTAEHYQYLNLKRGLIKSSIERYNLGFDNSKRTTYQSLDGETIIGRYSIPIPGVDELLRNIRLYAVNSAPQFKMINTKGYGSPPRLFPLHELVKYNWENIIFCEGEFDCILLNQEIARLELTPTWGAMTGTCGANSFEPEWLEWFYHRNFYMMLDVDPPSLASAHTHCKKFFLEPYKQGMFKSLKIVKLPLDGTKEANDVTDYLVKLQVGRFEDILRLINVTPNIEVGGVREDEVSVPAKKVDDFVTCIKRKEFIDQRIQVPITISGHTNRTYHAVRAFKVVSCPMMSGNKESCCNIDAGEKFVPYGHEIFIQACMANKTVLKRGLQEIACADDQPCQIEYTQKVVMEEHFASQVVTRWRAEENKEGKIENVQELVSTPVYILQPESGMEVKPQNYMATGWVRTHPNTQIVSLFVEHLEPLEDDWLSFSVQGTPKAKQNLESLLSLDTNPAQRVAKILEQLTNGVTQIYESDHILLVVLLTYLSVRWFNFNGRFTRGWINGCIIGDSGTGKSATYMRLSDWLELGDLFSVLTGRRTGLLYAVKQKATEWHIHLGRFVMANKKIIAIDETQQMPSDELEKMALAMDTGHLDVAQVVSGRYQTETRTLFLMNPPSGKTLTSYTYGCEALIATKGGLFKPMFIRRLDIAVFCTGNYNFAFYNKAVQKVEKADIDITPEMFKNLVYWAWTRTADQVDWTPEAEAVCLELATKMAEKYGHADDVPLVFPTDFRLNIARLTTAYAVLSMSMSEDMERLIIKPEHVQFIVSFFDRIYSDRSCDLETYSYLSSRKQSLTENAYNKIKETFEATIFKSRQITTNNPSGGNIFCQMLVLMLNSDQFRRRDLADQLGANPNLVKAYLNLLQGYDLLETENSAYKKTRKFNLFMQQWRGEAWEHDGPEVTTVREMLSVAYTKIGTAAINVSEMAFPPRNQHRQDDHGYSDYDNYRQSLSNEFDEFQ